MIDTLIITHRIKGIKDYAFSGNELYVLPSFVFRRSRSLKRIKMQTIGTCRGYFINRKFKSITWIESKMYPSTKVIIYKNQGALPF